MYECRCDERLKAKAEGSTRLTYTGFRGGLEHLKIETRLIDERFVSVNFRLFELGVEYRVVVVRNRVGTKVGMSKKEVTIPGST